MPVVGQAPPQPKTETAPVKPPAGGLPPMIESGVPLKSM